MGNDTMIGGVAGSSNEYDVWPQGATKIITANGAFDFLNFTIAVTGIGFDISQNDGTPQIVNGNVGTTVAITGQIEKFLGSPGDDTITAGSNDTVMGGAGNDKITVNGKQNVTVDGGADADSLQQTGGVNIVMTGDSGADTLTSIDGSNITMNGGADADSLQQTGGTGIVMSGDDGADTLISSGGTNITMSGGADADTLQQTGGSGIVMSGDDGADTLISSGGNSITMNGGADADTLQQTGGTGIIMSGDDGADTLLSFGSSSSGITMNGDAGNDTLQQVDGTNITMNGDDGLDTLKSFGGSGIIMNGGADADTLSSSTGTNITMHGDAGNDTLLQTNGTDINMNGDDGVDALNSTGGSGITMSGGADADSLTQIGGNNISMSGDDGLDTLVSSGGSAITMNGGADADLLNVTNSVNDTVAGGTGNDTYVFVGTNLGNISINEAALPAPDNSVDTLDFSSYGAPVNLDLSSTSPQQISAGTTLTLSDGMGIENVVGSGFADTIKGNGRDNTLLGADYLPPPTASPPPNNGKTQWVLLDFDSKTDPGEHIYTQSERDAIQARLVADYEGPDPLHPWFHVYFTQNPADPNLPPAGQYAHLYFNDLEGTEADTGGFSDDLDFRNLNPGGNGYIQVNGILGAPNQPPDTSDNWIALSQKIAAHELGHLMGLLHEDAFGPIDYGIHAPPGSAAYNPDYPGPASAYETFDHIMSSPASVGSNRFNDLGNLHFGEREAIKLAFAEDGTTVNELPQTDPSRISIPPAVGTTRTAQVMALTPLAVPNTEANTNSLNSMKQFAVDAEDVVGSIQIDPTTLKSEDDYYAFTGNQGDVVNIRIYSRALTRLGTNTIDSIVRLYDANGNLVAYFDGADGAFNDDNAESGDAELTDERLPATGTYFIQVDTFKYLPGDPRIGDGSDADKDTDTGGYELFVYRFKAGNPTDGGNLLQGGGGNDVLIGGPGNDTLSAGSGNDTLKGGAGDDTYVTAPGTATLAVIDSAGTDTLDFSAATVGVTVNLGLSSGQVQTISPGNTLALTGTVEIVIGTPFADSITGNDAGNVLFGGAGNDTLVGGLGNDILVGGDGNDILDGGDGRDLVIGGNGADSLLGSAGDDILVAGVTTYDGNLTALNAIRAEWTKTTDTYNQRMAFLTGTNGGANGTYFLIKGTTVLDDNKAPDTLTGGLGQDLFYTFSGDKVTDKEPGEKVF
jgi:Ca2+-binding RTX toxin-like protein